MRKSSSGYQSRAIDIDLLLYGASIIISKDLLIPHPHIAERRFVLAPMAEIAAEVIHPITEKNFQYLLNKSDDPLGVLQLDEKIWIPAKRNEKQNTETKSSKIRKKKAGEK